MSVWGGSEGENLPVEPVEPWCVCWRGGGECETSLPAFSMPLFFVNTSQEAHIRADSSLLCFCSHCFFQPQYHSSSPRPQPNKHTVRGEEGGFPRQPPCTDYLLLSNKGLIGTSPRLCT